MQWTAKDIPAQSGRRVVITGANSGIGFHTALELARHGAEVVLPARTQAKSLDAIERIRGEAPDAKLVPAVLDLASLASIRAFAKFYGEHFPGPSLDLHINNAGVMALPSRELTGDGFERQFATNVLGAFALTAQLFAHLKPQTGTRVVTLASIAAHRGAIDFENLQAERRYAAFPAYAQTKLADLIFALELQRRLSRAGSPVVSLGAHPGVATTNLTAGMGGLAKRFGPWVTGLVGQTSAQGALPTLFAATAEAIQPGGYYGPNGLRELKGYPAPAKIPSAATDLSIAERLWTTAERLTGVTFDIG